MAPRRPRPARLVRFLLAAVALVTAALLTSPAAALQAPSGLEALDEDGEEVLEVLASRPAALREAALVATQYPDVLIRTELIQARSSAAFGLRVQQLDREDQEELWELVRTPGLLSAIVEGGPKDEAALAEIAAAQPEAVRDIAVHLGTEHFALLEEAEAIKAGAFIVFGEEVAGLRDEGREAFQ